MYVEAMVSSSMHHNAHRQTLALTVFLLPFVHSITRRGRR
jgi:hypothetical protein